jgi:sterol desaturase/sphingolipid hydroxylase (fatty acid hydroxylase superfamily)
MEPKYVQIIILAAVFAMQYLFEHLFPQKQSINDWRNERRNLAVGLFNVVVTFLPAYLLVILIQFSNDHQLGLFRQFQIPSILVIVFSIVLMDLWMYVWHRLNHETPFFWKFHKFHHKDEKMNSTTAIRFHAAELILSFPGKAILCFLFGISYIPLLIYETIFFMSIVFHHSNMYISEVFDKVYRVIFSSPLMHRVHHSKKFEQMDSNFGAVFSFWDRLFGSYVPGVDREIEFGVEEKSFSTHRKT